MIVHLLKDDCSFDEWRIRHSIDMSIKVLSLLCSFVTFLVMALVLGKRGLYISSEKEYHNGIWLMGLSFSIDVVYFLVVFLINCSYFNIWKPLLFMHVSNNKVILALFILSFLYALLIF